MIEESIRHTLAGGGMRGFATRTAHLIRMVKSMLTTDSLDQHTSSWPTLPPHIIEDRTLTPTLILCSYAKVPKAGAPSTRNGSLAGNEVPVANISCGRPSASFQPFALDGTVLACLGDWQMVTPYSRAGPHAAAMSLGANLIIPRSIGATEGLDSRHKHLPKT